MKTHSLPSRRGRATATSGMTLVEMMCGAAILVVGLGAALITFVGVQRSLTTSLYQVNAQGDQSRVFSYLRRDLRGASSVLAAAQGTQLTITVPTQSTPTFNLNLGLSLLSLLGPPTTPAATNTISYYRQGTSIIREVNGVPTVLSSSAIQFQATMSGTLVQINAGFQPRYSLVAPSTATAATTASAFVHLLNTTSP